MAFKFTLVDPYGMDPHFIEPISDPELELRQYRPATLEEFEECLELAEQWVDGRAVWSEEDSESLKDLYAQLFMAESPEARRSVRLQGQHRSYDGRDLLCVLAFRQLETTALAVSQGKVSSVLWGLSGVHIALRELREITRSSAASARARHAAERSHERHSSFKQQALAFYEAHRSEYRTKEAAAESISSKVVPVAFGTVRKWLRGK